MSPIIDPAPPKPVPMVLLITVIILLTTLVLAVNSCSYHGPRFKFNHFDPIGGITRLHGQNGINAGAAANWDWMDPQAFEGPFLYSVWPYDTKEDQPFNQP